MSERDREQYRKTKADPAKYAAYIERKRRERSLRPASETERKRKWRAANQDKAKAQRIATQRVWRAVVKGTLIKPEACSRCGTVTELEAHHHLGYEPEHRLDVLWLCNACHAKEHYPQQTSATSTNA